MTSGPGLAGALLVGVAAAKALALGLGKPLYGVNHLASHVAVDQLEHGPLPDPCLALLVSGGHSSPAAGRGRDRPTSSRWAPPSTTRRGRRSTRWRGCSACPSRRSAHRPGRRAGQLGRHRLPARPHRAGATWSGTGSTSRSPGSRPPSRAGSRPASGTGEPVPVADVAASFQEAVCDVLVRKALDAAVDRASTTCSSAVGWPPTRGCVRWPRSAPPRSAYGSGCRGRASAPTTARWWRRSGRRWSRAGDAVRAGPAGRLQPAGHLGAGLTLGWRHRRGVPCPTPPRRHPPRNSGSSRAGLPRGRGPAYRTQPPRTRRVSGQTTRSVGQHERRRALGVGTVDRPDDRLRLAAVDRDPQQ